MAINMGYKIKNLADKISYGFIFAFRVLSLNQYLTKHLLLDSNDI